MKLLLAGGMLALAMAFCGIGDRLQSLTDTQSDSGQSGSPGGDKPGENPGGTDGGSKKPELTAAQKAIADKSTEVTWDDQGIKWKVPTNWPMMDVKKESFNYGSPAEGFLIATISVMPSTFPSETSLDATYQSALEQLKQGKYQEVNWLELDGVRGVEWVEAMPEEKDSPRRYQWIAFRNYQGQNQQLNIILSTKGSNFEKQLDTFKAILYSITIPKG